MVAEWRAALSDAGVDEADFYLLTCPGAAVTGQVKAASFDPGRVLFGDDEEGGIVVHEEKLAEANDDANLWRHRVAVLEDIDEDDQEQLAFLAGVLRHEIEHGKQRETAREAFGLYEAVDRVASYMAEGSTADYAELRNASPIEADANAAAAAHVRRRYPNAVADLLAGSDRHLVERTNSPGHPQTLVERTVDFLWQFRAICDDPKRLPADRTFADVLDSLVPDGTAGARWRELKGDQTSG